MPILKENAQPHSSVALCLMTMGCKVEEYLNECFMARKSLKGILADFMASTYMFQLDSRCLELVRAECAMRKQGVRERLEAPDQLPWEAAGRILEEIEMEETTGITVSPSGIFTPTQNPGLHAASVGRFRVLSRRARLHQMQSQRLQVEKPVVYFGFCFYK